MNMAAAQSESGNIPSISGKTDIHTSELPHSVYMLIIVHAICLAGPFGILFPLGVIFLRWFGQVKTHWVLQFLASLICAVGLAVAIAFSAMDLEYSSFNRGHQILGIVVVAALPLQSVFGYIHHLRYKQVGRRTLNSHLHLWTGRAVIVLGMINTVLYVSSSSPKTKHC